MPKDSYISGRCLEIETALDEAAVWSLNNDKLGAYLAGYLTVIISGVIEDCIEYLIRQRAARTGDFQVESFVAEFIRRRFGNPNHGQINGMLKDFSDEYSRTFTSRIPHDGSSADALNSIIQNKNELAHTGTWKLQMTLSDVRDYYHRVVPVLEAVEDILA